MSEEKGKVCCNCRHNIRIGTGADVECYCDVDNHYIGYVACMTHWCRKWAKERKKMEQRLIGADAVEKVLTDLYIKGPLDSDRWVIVDIEKGIRELPAVDAVPVIRCKDCKHWHRQYRHDVDISTCERTIGYFEANDYCSRAERKEK